MGSKRAEQRHIIGNDLWGTHKRRSSKRAAEGQSGVTHTLFMTMTAKVCRNLERGAGQTATIHTHLSDGRLKWGHHHVFRISTLRCTASLILRASMQLPGCACQATVTGPLAHHEVWLHIHRSLGGKEQVAAELACIRALRLLVHL